MTARDRRSIRLTWSDREKQVLELLAAGKTNAEIAEALSIAFPTAKWHVSELITKLGVTSREEVGEYWRHERRLLVRVSRGWQWGFGAVLVRAAGVTLVAAAAVGVAVAVVVLGSDSDQGPAAGPTPVATIVPTAAATTDPLPPGATAWPSTKRTGEPSVDAVIEAVLSGDRARVQALLQLVPVGCTKDPTPDPIVPPCGEDPAGTLRKAFPTQGCDVGWTDVTFPVVDFLLNRSPALYGVFRQQPHTAPAPDTAPSGTFVIVWRYTGLDTTGFSLEVEGGRVVVERGPCGAFPGTLIKGVPLGDFLVPPPGGLPAPTPLPAVRHTGDPANDRLIDAMTSGNWQLLAQSFQLFPEPCSNVEPRGVGSPPACPPGIPDGGTVLTTRVSSCETLRSTDPERTFVPLFRQLFAFGHELYAAFRPTQTLYPGDVPAGDMVVVLRRQNSTEGTAWHLASGRVVGLRLGCGGQASSFVKDVPPSAFVLPPLP